MSTPPAPSPDDVLAWHFLPANRCLTHGDGRVVRIGETLRLPGPVALAERGLHASRRPLHALGHAPGPVLCRVRMHGPRIEDDEKIVASARTALAMADASELLHRFALACAKRVLDRVSAPDPRSTRALVCKQQWLDGTTDEAALQAAWGEAWAAVPEAPDHVASAVAQAAASATAPVEPHRIAHDAAAAARNALSTLDGLSTVPEGAAAGDWQQARARHRADATASQDSVLEALIRRHLPALVDASFRADRSPATLRNNP